MEWSSLLRCEWQILWMRNLPLLLEPLKHWHWFILQHNLANSEYLTLKFFEWVGGINSVRFNPVLDSHQPFFIFLKVVNFYVHSSHDGYVLFPGPYPAREAIFWNVSCGEENYLVKEVGPCPGKQGHWAGGLEIQTSVNPLSDCTWFHVSISKGLILPPSACF